MRLYTATIVARIDETADDPTPRLSVSIDIEDGVPEDVALAIIPPHLHKMADDIKAQTERGDLQVEARDY